MFASSCGGPANVDREWDAIRVAGRLLGHRWASTTNRYVHLDDATLGEAAERVAVERKLRGGGVGVRSAARSRAPAD